MTTCKPAYLWAWGVVVGYRDYLGLPNQLYRVRLRTDTFYEQECLITLTWRYP
jgi:hypothetical protein